MSSLFSVMYATVSRSTETSRLESPFPGPAGAPPEGMNVLKGKISNRVFLGEVVDYIVDLGDGELRARMRADDFQIGQAVTIAVPPQKCVGLADS